MTANSLSREIKNMLIKWANDEKLQAEGGCMMLKPRGRLASPASKPSLGNGERVLRESVNLAAKLATFSAHWSPKTVAEFNGDDVMVVKVQGEFVWHSHADTDDFFLVLQGRLTIELRDRKVQLGPGELFVVPKGVEHRPVAEEEVHLLLIEPSGTPNTGDVATAAPRELI